jgi:rubrerythrin
MHGVMGHQNLAYHLQRLAQLDVDAIASYEAAIDRIDVTSVRQELDGFRVDHVRHLQDLNALLVAAGAEPVETKTDLKGALLKGFTAATSTAGVEAALLAMVANEELTNHTYAAALGLPLLPEQRRVVEKNYDDEKRHLAWLKRAARERPWRHERRASAAGG